MGKFDDDNATVQMSPHFYLYHHEHLPTPAPSVMVVVVFIGSQEAYDQIDQTKDLNIIKPYHGCITMRNP